MKTDSAMRLADTQPCDPASLVGLACLGLLCLIALVVIVKAERLAIEEQAEMLRRAAQDAAAMRRRRKLSRINLTSPRP